MIRSMMLALSLMLITLCAAFLGRDEQLQQVLRQTKVPVQSSCNYEAPDPEPQYPVNSSSYENHNVSSIEEYIERLDSYIETSGKKYKNHFAVIGKWLSEDSKKADCKPAESASAAASDKYKFLINNI